MPSLSRWWLVAVLLALCLPALAQPQTVGEMLSDLGCREACVCRVVSCARPHDCRAFDPAIPWAGEATAEQSAATWLRYGFPERPTHVGDGTHNIGATEAEAAIEADPGRFGLPAGYELTEADRWDLSKVWCGKKTARARVIAMAGGSGGGGEEPVPATCYPGWRCDPLPAYLFDGCRADDGTYNCRDVRFRAGQLPACWMLGGTTHLGRTLHYAKGVPGCDPTLSITEPPPPPPICGDGTPDPGEDCDSCPADQPEGACEVEPGPGPNACSAALDAVESAVASAREVCDGE